jgi:predicted phage-related endonuclease
MATPDGIAYHRRRPTNQPAVRKYGTFKSKPHAVVQVKTDATTAEWGGEGTDQIPSYYLAQVRWEMLVMDVRTAYLPVLFSGPTYREYVVHQDDSDVELMVREASDFLDRLRYDNPPDVDWRAATTRALQQLHPDRGEGSVEVPGTWIRQWQLADRLVDAAGKRKALAENRIRALVGDRHFATVNGEPLANKVVYDQRRADLDALKRAGLYDQYTRTITINRLAIARPKKGPTK